MAISRTRHEAVRDAAPLSADHALGILTHIVGWKQAEIEDEEEREDARSLQRSLGLALSQAIMPALRDVEISPDLVRGVFDVSDPTRLPAVMEALPEIANRDGCPVEKVVERIRLALASTRLEACNSALNAIVAWSDLSVETGKSFPPELATEIANCCLARKPRTLYRAFYAATKLARAEQFSIDDVRKLVASLDLLIVEASYENVVPNDPLAVSLTLLRRECVRLSSVLSTSSNAPIILKWLDLIESDPMPEVRFALSDNSDSEA